MKAFAALLDRLVLTPRRNEKLLLLTEYFRAQPDPDRGYALAALAGTLELNSVKPALLRALTMTRVDSELFAYSYDYVGDLAETISLIWPAADNVQPVNDLSLGTVITTLQQTSRNAAPQLVETLLDALDVSERYALLKLVTGGLRIGVSARLAKQALADFGQVELSEVEELWHGLTPPYVSLFSWLDGSSSKPENDNPAPFRPVMLATPLDEAETEKLTPEDFAAEWKWDGIRVQAVSENGVKKLYSRSGDDITHAFPDIVSAIRFEGALDGELLIRHADGKTEPASFNALQQRLNRKTVTARQLQDYPAFIRVYDLLHRGNRLTGSDLRNLPFAQRRQHLEDFIKELDPSYFDLSPLLTFQTFAELRHLRNHPPHAVIEGLMLKRTDSVYSAGRPKGPWYKWKRDPYIIDAVLIYAQRGHGKRSSYYSDFTFAVWSDASEQAQLLPVGKAYSGFSDEEMKQLDRFVRENTIQRFGPVRAVRADRQHGLVVEVAFEGLNRSTRHKSGLAMRFPRISRLRWDKPSAEADIIQNLIQLLPDNAAAN
ncbi:cisplatin damage response ATP-dependent DNA ligase [Ochrobactrum sp. GRS2]|nr:cisplatin damage response ATP-dependent DNA ligase [Ochrobactrum sp. GRS2]